MNGFYAELLQENIFIDFVIPENKIFYAALLRFEFTENILKNEACVTEWRKS